MVTGSLPPGLTMPAKSGSGTVIAAMPPSPERSTSRVKRPSTGAPPPSAYQITITVQGPPDQFVCDPADNGGFLISGTCVLPNTASACLTRGTCPPAAKRRRGSRDRRDPARGPDLPATFGGSSGAIGGTAGQPGVEPTYRFTVRAPTTRASRCTRPTRSPWTPTSRDRRACLRRLDARSPGPVGQAYAQNFFLSGGAGPSPGRCPPGQLPPGLFPAELCQGRATPTTSSPGHRPRPAPTPGPCGSPTSTASRPPGSAALKIQS